MDENARLARRREAAVPRGISTAAPFFVAKALNAELWDVEGRRYIDFAGGIGALNTGHRHPRVVAAVKAQLDAFIHCAFQVAAYEPYVALAERLGRLAPVAKPAKALLLTTGSEAVENAVKIARAYTGRSGVIAFGGAFHGRTLLTLALTGKVAPYKLGFGPFPGEVFHVPFPTALHGPTVEETLRAIERLFRTDVDPLRVAAIVIEPVQGEGGFYPAPAALMTALRRLCDANGILLVADEVQSGFARTGRWFAMEHHDVRPDLVTMAKSLAGGTPLSAVVGRAEVMDAPTPGGLGGTYGGNPLAVAAALAVLDVIEEERLAERAERLGERLRARLAALRPEVPRLAEVRGPGAMVAMEFLAPDGSPDAGTARTVQARALASGLLLLTCGTYANVIRFLFPLTIEDAVFEEALGILERAVRG
jgi:4-aminobutyrate aminotransferase